MVTREAEELLTLLWKRRTRRFARGLQMLEKAEKGPLTYKSKEQPQSLDSRQVAYLACAAVGVVGPSLGDLPYQNDEYGGGNILSRLVSRVAVSPDAAHTVGLFVINDDEVRFLKRPQNLTRDEIDELGKIDDVEGRYEALSVVLASRAQDEKFKRPELKDERPFVPTFNRWASNKAGTTYFLPVMELSELYLSALFGGLNEHAGYFLVDDRNGLAPAGLATFAKSEGGWLDDDPKGNKIFPLDALDTSVAMFASVELGAITQNLSLMAQALGVGGWPHYASGTKWLEVLGFESRTLKTSRTLGLSPDLATALRLTGKDEDVWSPLGLVAPNPGELRSSPSGPDERYLIKPYAPEYYGSVEKAVRAFADHKFNETGGRFRVGGDRSAWRDEEDRKKEIPAYTERQIAAAVEHAEYVYERYGRFPAKFGPVATLTAFQAHVLDDEFYRRYYEPEVLNDLRSRPVEAAAAQR